MQLIDNGAASEKRRARALKAAESKRLLARSVTMWLDAADRPHKTREEATAASRRVHAENAVRELFSGHDEETLVTTAVIEHMGRLAQILRKL